MRAAVPRVRQKMLRMDGKQRWNSAQLRGNGPMSIENGGVIRGNGGRKDGSGGLG